MIPITKQQATHLRRNNLEQYVHVVNKTHRSRDKQHYATENEKVFKALDGMVTQKTV